MYTSTKRPGRYEANRSELLAQVLENIVTNGVASDETGDCETTGRYARIDGKRYSYLLETDSNGFIYYQIVPKTEIENVWASVVKNIEQLQGEE